LGKGALQPLVLLGKPLAAGAGKRLAPQNRSQFGVRLLNQLVIAVI
jgi:hypothetical protein